MTELIGRFVGTSTGGILACGLTIPGGASNVPKYTMSDILELYTKNGKHIFSQAPQSLFAMRSRLMDRMNQLFNVKYTAKSMNSIMKTYFGDCLLSECITNVMIPR